MRICPTCKTSDQSKFNSNKANKDGLQVYCRECWKLMNKANSAKVSSIHKKWREKNKDKIRNNFTRWTRDNAEHVRQYGADARQKRRCSALGRATTAINAARCRAKKKGIECSIEPTEIAKVICKGQCEVTGISFDLLSKVGPFVPSLERTDPLKGYTPENVKVVVFIYNAAKNNWRHSDVLKLAEALLNVESSKIQQESLGVLNE
jgi:hypothetical protein